MTTLQSNHIAALLDAAQSTTPQYRTKAPQAPSGILVLPCCLPQGETYTNQPANRTARALERRARIWIAENPEAYARLLTRARALAMDEDLFVIADAVCIVREQAAADRAGFIIDASIFSALERIICEDAPEVREHVILAPSVFELAHRERHS